MPNEDPKRQRALLAQHVKEMQNEGYSNAEIAEHLDISEAEVRNLTE